MDETTPSIHPRKPVVMVTGASGALGSAVCARLQQAYTVVGLDIEEPDDWQGTAFFQCDLTSPESVRSAFARTREMYGSALESVIHLAEAHDINDVEELKAVDVDGTRNLLAALKQEMGAVDQLIVASTAEVVAPSEPGGRVEGDTEVLPDTPWPRARRLVEALTEVEDAPRTVVLRMGHLYGRQNVQAMMERLARRMLHLNPATLAFTGSPELAQPVLHILDAVRCIELCISHRHQLAEREILLVAEPKPVSYRMLLSRFSRQLIGYGLPQVTMPKVLGRLMQSAANLLGRGNGEDEEAPPLTAESRIDVSHVRQKLDWSPSYRLEAHLDELMKALADQMTGSLRGTGSDASPS